MAVEGQRGLFRGFSAAMYRAIPVNAGIFLAVEGTRNLISKVRSGRSAGRSQQACVPPAGCMSSSSQRPRSHSSRRLSHPLQYEGTLDNLLGAGARETAPAM